MKTKLWRTRREPFSEPSPTRNASKTARNRRCRPPKGLKSVRNLEVLERREASPSGAGAAPAYARGTVLLAAAAQALGALGSSQAGVYS